METTNAIQQIYIGLLGRAADQEGLQYWTDEIEAGTLTLEQLRANIVEEQPEYEATFGGQTRAQVVSQLYANLFNRAPDDEGLQYWVNGEGASVNIDQLVLALVNGAAAADSLVLDNRTEVANYYTEELGAEGSFDAELAGSVVADVDGTRASVEQAKASVDSGDIAAPGTGGTFTLTDGIDNVPGTAGNDTILAGTSNGNLALNAGDQINGGAGTDTLKVYDGLENFGSATISNVEIVDSYDANQVVDVSSNADIEQIWLYKASTNAATAAKTQVIGFGDAAGGAAAVGNFTADAGSADAATIAVKDAGKTTAYTSITVADIENLTVNATGASQLGNLVAANAEILTFTGEGSVKATLLPGTTVLKSVDASANEGGVNLSLTDAQFGTNEIKVTGGTGADTIAFTDALGAKATVDLGEGKDSLEITQGTTAPTAGSTFNGGAGTDDTLVLNATTTAVNATTGKMFTGFENVTLKGASSFQVGHVAGITGFEIASVTNSSASITNLAEASTVKISASSTSAQTLTLADNSAATASVNVELNNGAAGKAAAAGVATEIDTNAHVLNVESAGNVNATANAVDLTGATSSLAQITNIVVTGDQAANITTDAATALTLIDGSNATGKLNLDATGATKSMTIKGGSANDTITASDVAGVVSTITGGKGADTIALGATDANNKGDVIKLTGQADSTAAAFDKITNFTGATTAAANADKIDVSAFGFTGAQADMFTLGAAQVTTAGTGVNATFTIADTAAQDFFANAGADKGVALYTTSTETFAFIDADKNGNWDAGTDSVMLLGGDYSTDALTAAGSFTFA